MSNLLKRGFYILLLLFTVFFLVSCEASNVKTLHPSELFYIHDDDHILLNATQWTIFDYGVELYEDSKSNDIESSIRGSQVVVVATYELESNLDSTTLFNEWGIGENDMGILIILFFTRDGEDSLVSNVLVEIGARMSTYLSAFEASNLLDTYFYDPLVPDFNYDLKLMQFYFKLLEKIYLDIYDYSSYNYDSFIDEYLYNQYEYFGSIPRSQNFEFTWETILWIILGIILFGFGGSLTYIFPLFIFKGLKSPFKGGGGKSFGYWFKR